MGRDPHSQAAAGIVAEKEVDTMINMNHINDFAMEAFFTDCEATKAELEDKLESMEEEYKKLLEKEPTDCMTAEWEEWDNKETELHKEIDHVEDLVNGLETVLSYQKGDFVDVLKWLRWQEDLIK